MPGWLSDCSVFFREFRQNFHTTGAVLPSGRFLCRALARYVRDSEHAGGRQILEVGPGTGAATRQIVRAMRDDDCLDLVELNDRFVAKLRQRFERDPRFMPVAERSQVFHCPLEELPDDKRYDLIVSGLPLNNFSVELVEQLLNQMLGLLQPGGTLSFFEYIAIRRMKVLLSRKAERERLRGITRIMATAFASHEIQRDGVPVNVPPAWVHHLRV